MAAYRKNVPLRQTSTIEIDDGTTCRMPSPLPGPLRAASPIESWTSEETFADRRRSLRGPTDTASPGAITLAKGKAA